MVEKIDKLIEHYQAEADKLKKAVQDTSDSDETISVNKAMYSLWRTCCNFIADLDELAVHCEIAEVVEDCDECGFCKHSPNGDCT